MLTRAKFEYAHEAAPNVKLYLNDFNTETISNKSLKYAEITQGLLDQGAPIDGFGFQCHFIGGSVPEDIAETMRLFTDQGLEVAFTELDVRVPVNNRGLTNSTWLDIQYVSSPAPCPNPFNADQDQGSRLLERCPGLSRQ